MNEQWPTTTIGDLFDIGAGKSVTPVARHGKRRHPFLRTSNVLWGRIDLAEVDAMQFSDDEIANKSLAKGDLLVCEGGDIGRAAIWEGQLPQCSFQNHLHRLRPKSEETVPHFYMYYLEAGFTKLGLYQGAGNTTTIPNLSRSRLAALEVPRPSRVEQRHVADVLLKVQRATEVEETLITSARELKQATMRQLFTFGIRGERQQDSELGPIPESWDIVRLGDVCRLSTGTTPATKRTDYYQGQVPFIKTFEIVNNRITEASTFLSAEAVADYSLQLYPAGTVLMAMYGQGKTRGQVALLEIAAATTQNAAAIQPNGDLDAAFLWQYLRSSYDRLRGMGSLGHLSHLNLGYLRDLTLVKPPISQQREIADVLHIQDRMVSTHTRKREELTELFNHLLDGLMTGRIRIAHDKSST